MKLRQSILLAASLALTACVSSSPNRLTVHVVEASGGAWSASKLARAAMENLPGVDRMMMNGTRATLVLAGGAKLTDAQVTKALKAQGLKFETLNQHKIDRAGAAYIAKTPKFTWAATAKKVRATFMQDLAGVQDVFCGAQTVVYMKPGSTALSPEAIQQVFKSFKVACDGVVRDDSVIL